MPRSLAVTRVLLYLMFALTLLGAIGVLNSLLELGTHITPTLTLAALYALVPGIAAVILARRLWTGGKVVWLALIGLQGWLLVGSIVNLYGGSARGLSQLLLPGALLVLVGAGASRAWFELPAEQRAVRPRWTLERLRREGIPSISHLIGWRRNRGQTTAEYVGMIGLVALIIGALVLGGVGTQIANGLQTAVCNILGGDCDSDAVAGGGGESGGGGNGGGTGGTGGTGNGGGDNGGGDSGGGDNGGGDSGGGDNGGGDSGGGDNGGGDSGGSNGGGDSGGGDNGGGSDGGSDGGGSNGGGSDGGRSSGGGSNGGGSNGGGSDGGSDGGGSSGGGSNGGGSNGGGSNGGGSNGGSNGGGSSGGGSNGGGSNGGGSNGGGSNGGGSSGGGSNGGGSNGGGSNGGGSNGGGSNGGGSNGGGSNGGGSNGGGSSGGGSNGGGSNGGGSSSGGSTGGRSSGGGSNGGSSSGGSSSGGSSSGGSSSGGGSNGGGSSGGGSSSGGSDSGGSGGETVCTPVMGPAGITQHCTGPDKPDKPDDDDKDDDKDKDDDGKETVCTPVMGPAGITQHCTEQDKPDEPDDDDKDDDKDDDNDDCRNKNVAFYNRVTPGGAGSGRYTLASAGIRTPVVVSGTTFAAGSGIPSPLNLISTVSGSTIAGVDTFQDVKDRLTIAIGLTDPPPPPIKEDPEPEPEPEPEPGPEDCPVGKPNPNPHPEVMEDDYDIKITGVDQEDIKWRDSDEPLYRFDDRPPEDIFLNGFDPKNPDNGDLYDYVTQNTDSAFVGTTRNEQPDLLYEDRKYRYDIDPPGGIDVNGTLGDNSRWSSEEEVAFPGGIDSRYIKGAWEINPDGSLGKYIPNDKWYEPPNERD
ncbi:hypothetical protein ACFV9P_27050 [Streptomyces sp. NPDC059892]|uniref:scabin-related ADP-ribosyltransferase n=1 Tax=Streptomyces sp. NPDC059892 TaxID=3346989 RepID=UPI003662ABE9